MVAVEEARVDLDGNASLMADIEQAILVVLERLLGRPSPERRRNVEVPGDVRRQFLEIVEQLGGVEFPERLGANRFVKVDELLTVKGPRPVGPFFRMLDRNEMHRADNSVGAQCVNDILCVGARARIVIHLSADRKSHAPAQPLRDDRGVRRVDAGRFGRTDQVARLCQLERPANRGDRSGILECQIVGVVRDHQKAWR